MSAVPVAPCNKLWIGLAGTAQQVFEWGAKEECVKESLGGGRGRGGHACGFLFNLSKVTENAIITIKLLIFFSTSSVMLLSGLKIHHH